MDQKYFQILLRRYLDKKCTEDEIQKIDLWFDKIAMDGIELDDIERESIHEEILNGLQLKLALRETKKNKVHALLSHSFLKVAAVVTIFLATGYYLFMGTQQASGGKSKEVVMNEDWVIIESASGETLKIQLPDGSSVSLASNSSISYSKKWIAAKREVRLTGEAFFEVVKDHKRPFFVYSGDLVTRVLGTSFVVRALPKEESVEVKVRSGKVSVYEKSMSMSSGIQSNPNEIILTPNHQLKYFKEKRRWVTGLVEEPLPLRVIEESSEFVFDEAQLSSIITQIERDFLIQIVVEEEQIYTCTFTGDVSKLKLFDMLEVICKSTGLDFEVKGTLILINGKGCD